MPKSKIIAIAGIGISLIAIAFLSATLYSKNSLSAQNLAKQNNIGGHTPGYPIIHTRADVLDPISTNIDPKLSVVEPMKYLREFNYGRISKLSNGTTVREFTLIATDQNMKEVSPGISYNVWTFNGTIPGPTLRATEGDIVRVIFINNGSKFHSIHFHGIHSSDMDGVFDGVAPGGKFVYEFTAEPFGVFPYHCHMQPLEEHIGHGLYGVYIVDPKKPRPNADEMVMVMNGYDTDFDNENNFYTVNGIPYYYMHHPIQIEKNRLIRIYLVNMLEFDPLNNFHLHANLFNYYKTGTRMVPDDYTDIVSLNQGERGILEFSYKFPGLYMFHAHKTEFAEKGWMGTFLVRDSPSKLVNATLISPAIRSVSSNMSSGEFK